jgi:hypothetical protein
MRKAKVFTGGILAVAAFAFSAAPANSAAPPATGSPGCNGLIVATFNHNSGVLGASGNPNASAGPGYFLKQATSDGVHAVQDFFCP